MLIRFASGHSAVPQTHTPYALFSLPLHTVITHRTLMGIVHHFWTAPNGQTGTATLRMRSDFYCHKHGGEAHKSANKCCLPIVQYRRPGLLVRRLPLRCDNAVSLLGFVAISTQQKVHLPPRNHNNYRAAVSERSLRAGL